MADGIVQVPPDSTGKKVDAASMDVGANTVYRQRIVIGDNSATAQFAVVTGGALVVTGTMNISAMPTVTVTGGVAVSGTAVCQITSSVNLNISAMPAVALAAGAANIGSINNISATVSVINAAGTALMGAVSLAAGTANIGFINGISATVSVVLAAGTANFGTLNNISKTVEVTISTPFTVQGISTTVTCVVSGWRDNSGTSIALIDSANTAMRVNVVAGNAAGVSQVDGTSFNAQTSSFAPIGGIFDDASPGTLSENDAGVCRVTTNRALHVNLRKQDGTEIDLSSTPSVVLAVGTNNFGTLNNISATVSVLIAAGTANIGAVSLAAGTANIGFINNISATVTCVISGFTPAIMSASHGPKCVTASTSANVTLIASPGAGQSIYITQLAVSNSGASGSRARIGTSASAATIVMFCASAGGGFVLNFNPPWKLSASEAAVCSVKPNTADGLFNVNFFVAP